MAKQSSHVKLQGTVGGITYTHGPNGYKAYEKKPVNKAKFETDPRFKRFRENGQEFARAGKAGKLLRTALKNMLTHYKERTTSTRLTSEMMKVIKADNVNKRGERKVLPAQTEMLNGFLFNKASVLTDVLQAPIIASATRTTGALTIQIDAFAPTASLRAPVGATHFKFEAAGIELDFDNDSSNTQLAETPLISLSDMQVPATTLSCQLTAASTLPLFQVLGIRFFEMVNGDASPIVSGSFDALVIMNVSGQ